jgi:hypothetical protein
MWRVWVRGEVCTEFWWGNLMERDHLEDPGVDERIKLRNEVLNGLYSSPNIIRKIK